MSQTADRQLTKAGGLCSSEGRLALMLGMYQKEGLGRERATVERRRRQAVGGTNKLSGGATVLLQERAVHCDWLVCEVTT